MLIVDHAQAFLAVHPEPVTGKHPDRKEALEIKDWLDTHPEFFSRYLRDESRIDLYLENIVGSQPWLLKKTYFFPYLFICIEPGCGIESHVYRDSVPFGEEYITVNPFKYILPALGVFRYLMKPMRYVYRLCFRLRKLSC